MTRLLCLLALFVPPLAAVDVTIAIGGDSETFTVSGQDIAALTQLRNNRRDEDDNCPPIDGVVQDCSTTVKYAAWKLKQLFNHGKDNHPQGQDAVDRAAIGRLERDIRGRRVK